jgi:hypothetical protein
LQKEIEGIHFSDVTQNHELHGTPVYLTPTPTPTLRDFNCEEGNVLAKIKGTLCKRATLFTCLSMAMCLDSIAMTLGRDALPRMFSREKAVRWLYTRVPACLMTQLVLDRLSYRLSKFSHSPGVILDSAARGCEPKWYPMCYRVSMATRPASWGWDSGLGTAI